MRVLLTGATGFVGMELLVRYLERTDRRVYALVRGTDGHEATARIERSPAATAEKMAVRSAQLQRPKENQSRNLRSIVDLVRPSVENLLATDLKHDLPTLFHEAVRANIRASAMHLSNDTWLPAAR